MAACRAELRGYTDAVVEEEVDTSDALVRARNDAHINVLSLRAFQTGTTLG